jgi:hypothetical protein
VLGDVVDVLLMLIGEFARRHHAVAHALDRVGEVGAALTAPQCLGRDETLGVGVPAMTRVPCVESVVVGATVVLVVILRRLRISGQVGRLDDRVRQDGGRLLAGRQRRAALAAALAGLRQRAPTRLPPRIVLGRVEVAAGA